MPVEQPFALHLTWTCYGTWLPGDERGHVSNVLVPTGGFQRKQNTPGTPISPGDAYTRTRAKAAQRYPAVWLTTTQALWAGNGLVAAARERSWRILRAAIMPNHAHVVITDCPDDGPTVRCILKGVSQAAMSREAGQPWRWWTAGGSDRYKHGMTAIETAVTYVANQPQMLVAIVDMHVSVVAEEQ